MIIKICGIMSLAAAQAAKESGADLIGFVFAAGKRQMEPAAVRQIAAAVKGIAKAGVFVNAPLSEVVDIARQCNLDYVQLHGEETAEYCRAVGTPVIKAVRWREGIQIDSLAGCPADWLLVDSYASGQYGGTGVAFDWKKAKLFRAKLAKPVMIAGGLSPDNVAEAIRILRPDGVDVSSGVESGGIKDAEKIAAFVTVVRRVQGGETHAG